MSAVVTGPWVEVARPAEPSGQLRWGACCVVVMLAHVAGAWLLLHDRMLSAPAMGAPPAAVMLDLAPLPTAAPVAASAAPPAPRQNVSPPPPPKPPARALATLPRLDVARVAVPLPAKAAQKTPPETTTSQEPSTQPDTPAPSAPTASAERASPEPSAAAPAPEAPATAPSRVATNWQGRIMGRLERFKRYPHDAQSHRLEGVPLVRFTLDRRGKVLALSLEKSSGVAALDVEALALVRRAEPLPPPPADIPGDPVELVVPVEFFL